MESLTLSIIATFHAAAAMMPVLLAMFALAALAMGMMDLLTQSHWDRAGNLAKRPARDLVPQQVLIALHEPPLWSMTGRRAAAPSRAPPSTCHLFYLTALPFRHSVALPAWPDFAQR